jgi:hypothetical protein
LLRLRCGERGHDKLLAFSCKRRGFCPSCGTRWMFSTSHQPTLPARDLWLYPLRRDFADVLTR